MAVDVVQMLNRGLRLLQGSFHGSQDAITVGLRTCEMAAIGGTAIPDDLTIYLGVPLLGATELLEN